MESLEFKFVIFWLFIYFSKRNSADSVLSLLENLFNASFALLQSDLCEYIAGKSKKRCNINNNWILFFWSPLLKLWLSFLNTENNNNGEQVSEAIQKWGVPRGRCVGSNQDRWWWIIKYSTSFNLKKASVKWLRLRWR